MKKRNKVVIIGRTNVGKSTLFNRLSKSVKSMTLDYEGVTRDFVFDSVDWQGRTFEIIDTGGIDFKKGLDYLTEAVRERAIEVLESSDVVIFVVDGKVGVTSEDQALAKFVHKLNKPTILAINKIDTKKTQENILDFHRLGHKNVLEISGQHGTGTAELLEEILRLLPSESSEKDEKPEFKIVLLGKPNVGKSSLTNLLLDKQRSLVADMPGTTREAITDHIKFYRETIQVTDTAGVRRKRSVDETIEELMVKSSFAAVRDADIVLLLIDGEEAELSQQELKLAGYVFQEGKALIILRNKHDLIDDTKQTQWEFESEPYDYLLKKLEMMTISCKTRHNVGKIMPLIRKVWDRYNTHFSTTQLTMTCKGGLDEKPLFKNRQRLKLHSVQQVATAPPIIRLNVNHTEWFGESQLGFFENVMRKQFDLKSVPIKFALRKMIF
ncbi:MAG: GTP-binding protein [Alteromonas naphthalenivorans]|jgi:GTP-binding protein